MLENVLAGYWKQFFNSPKKLSKNARRSRLLDALKNYDNYKNVGEITT